MSTTTQLKTLKSKLSDMRQRQTRLKRSPDRKPVMSLIAQNSREIFHTEQQLVEVRKGIFAAMTPEMAARHALKVAEQRLRDKRNYYMSLSQTQHDLKAKMAELTRQYQREEKAVIQKQLRQNALKLTAYFKELKELKQAYSAAHTALYQLTK